MRYIIVNIIVAAIDISILVGTIGCVAGVVWGLILTTQIVYPAIGLIGAILSIVLAPVTLLVVPWYAGLILSNWFPLVICYGGFYGGGIVCCVGWCLLKRLRVI
ncbi:hypothetical protein KAX06_05650 [candidate division WOR-3 bacterium]|nr:hypothetical protein [candidate division WOR-3 bacterium]